MKKIHRKIISSQARYVEKICSDVESITKSRKLIGGVNYCYSREERSEIRNFNPDYYKPHKIKRRIRSLNDFKKAAVMRELYTTLSYLKFGVDTKYCRKKGRQKRIDGNRYEEKKIICKALNF